MSSFSLVSRSLSCTLHPENPSLESGSRKKKKIFLSYVVLGGGSGGGWIDTRVKEDELGTKQPMENRTLRWAVALNAIISVSG